MLKTPKIVCTYILDLDLCPFYIRVHYSCIFQDLFYLSFQLSGDDSSYLFTKRTVKQ